jgi:RNA polymerase sigma factor (sigma-70 family)
MPNISANESLLWSQFVCGDEAGFTELFRHFSKPLFNYGIKIVSDKELLKECLQELFVNLWHSRQKLAPDVTSVQSYLFLSFKRLLLKKKRKGLRIIPLSNTDSGDFLADYSIEQLLIEKENATEQERRLLTALSQLTARQKEAIYLKFYQNMSYEEIGEVMNINYQSLRSLVYKAIKMMHQQLTGAENFMPLGRLLPMLFI